MASSFDIIDREFQEIADNILEDDNDIERQFVELFQDMESDEKAILNFSDLEKELEEISFNDYPEKIPKPENPLTRGSNTSTEEAALNTTSTSGSTPVKNDIDVRNKKEVPERKAEKEEAFFDLSLLSEDFGFELLGEEDLKFSPTECSILLNEFQRKLELLESIVNRNDEIMLIYKKNANELKNLAQNLKPVTTPEGDIKASMSKEKTATGSSAENMDDLKSVQDSNVEELNEEVNASEDDEREATINELLTYGLELIIPIEF